MHALNQWVIWRLDSRADTPKPTKIPYSALTGEKASSTDPSHWTDYATAYQTWQAAPDYWSGIGFVFTADDPYFFLDLDGCYDVTTGTLSEDAKVLCEAFSGAMWEFSQSGEGIHIVGKCDKPRLVNKRNKWDGWKECYLSGRFMALGSAAVHGFYGGDSAAVDWTDVLLSIVPDRPPGDDGSGMPQRRADWAGPEDDDELIRRMLASRGGPGVAFGERCPVQALWEGNGAVLSGFFPPFGGPGAARGDGAVWDRSAADQALMNALAFWTGCDHERMVRLFSRSALGQRDKWRNRSYYRNRTTGSSIRACRNVYQGNRSERRAQDVAIGADLTPDGTSLFAPLLTLDEMLERFYYITQASKGGGAMMIDASRYTSMSVAIAKEYFTASRVSVPSGKVDMITGTEEMREIPAFDVWKAHPQRKNVDMLTWKPNSPCICEAPEQHGTAFNTWRGFKRPQFADYFIDGVRSGDESARVTRDAWLVAWHEHLAYLVPVASERKRFEQWLAHILQHPDELPQTAYLMYAERATGIGRNWLSSVLVRVMRGYVASGVDITAVLDGNFNGRLSERLLAIVDEAKAGMQDNKRYQRAETLKSEINKEYREIDRKFGSQAVEKNCMRWLFFSNHADALPFDEEDRRINVIANPTVRRSDEYYDWLYSHVSREEFISAVFAHLYTLDLSDFRVGERSMMNEAKRSAMAVMSSPVVTALRELRETHPNPVVTVRTLRGLLTMNFDIEAGGLSPRALGHALRDAGIVTISQKGWVNNAKETIAILRKFNPSDLYKDGSWKVDLTSALNYTDLP